MGNVFNRYGAGGGKSEGLYIWKKYQYTPRIAVVNPQMTAYSKSSTSLWFNNANFDYKAFEQINETLPIKYTDYKDFVDFFDGFVATDGTRFDIEKRVYDTYDSMSINMNGSYGNVNRYVTTDTYFYFGFNGYPTVDGVGVTFAYNGTKTLPAKIGDMVGYVVSDKEDAYPDKEVKDGYYYEKCGNLLEDLNYKKAEFGSFTLSSNAYSSTVNHSLGETPKCAIAWKDDGADFGFAFFAVNVYGTTDGAWASAFLYTTTKTVNNSSNTGGATVTTAKICTATTASMYFEKSKKYNYVLLA